MIYSIGHSNHPIERFVSLLVEHHIAVVADVRSSPFSRFNPHFNRESLKRTLAERGIDYLFYGAELGARTKDPSCYDGDRVSYAKLAATESFQHGLTKLETEMARRTTTMMCAEREPLTCHRTILIARELERRGIQVMHILEDGALEPQQQSLARLVIELGLPAHDLFRNAVSLQEQAYEMQAERIAYVRPAK